MRWPGAHERACDQAAIGDAAAALCREAVQSGTLAANQVRNLVLDHCAPRLIVSSHSSHHHLRGGRENTASSAAAAGGGLGAESSDAVALTSDPRGISSRSDSLQQLVCESWESCVALADAAMLQRHVAGFSVGVQHCIGASFSADWTDDRSNCSFASRLAAATASAVCLLGVDPTACVAAAAETRAMDDRSSELGPSSGAAGLQGPES